MERTVIEKGWVTVNQKNIELLSIKLESVDGKVQTSNHLAAHLCWVKTSQLSCYSNLTNCWTILHIKTLRVKLVPITSCWVSHALLRESPMLRLLPTRPFILGSRNLCSCIHILCTELGEMYQFSVRLIITIVVIRPDINQTNHTSVHFIAACRLIC